MVDSLNSIQALNKLNWDNLIELYGNVAKSNDKILIVDKTVTSFLSKEYGWPNLTLISEMNQDPKSVLSEINNLIENKAVSPFILIGPQLSHYHDYDSIFDIYNIRQIDQWAAIYYETLNGLPNRYSINDFEVKIVSDKEQLLQWINIVSSVLFNGKKLPLTWFENKQDTLLLGYINSIPVATSYIYNGSSIPSIHMVATLPDYRNKGFGKAIFLHSMSLVYDKYPYILAQATRLGLKPWLDLGFNISGYYNIYWKIGHY